LHLPSETHILHFNSLFKIHSYYAWHYWLSIMLQIMLHNWLGLTVADFNYFFVAIPAHIHSKLLLICLSDVATCMHIKIVKRFIYTSLSYPYQHFRNSTFICIPITYLDRILWTGREYVILNFWEMLQIAIQANQTNTVSG